MRRCLLPLFSAVALLIGIVLPFALPDADAATPLCHEQVQLLTPKISRLLTLRIVVRTDGTAFVGSPRTLFGIPLNTVTFPSLADCEAGTRAHITY